MNPRGWCQNTLTSWSKSPLGQHATPWVPPAATPCTMLCKLHAACRHPPHAPLPPPPRLPCTFFYPKLCAFACQCNFFFNLLMTLFCQQIIKSVFTFYLMCTKTNTKCELLLFLNDYNPHFNRLQRALIIHRRVPNCIASARHGYECNQHYGSKM